MTGFRINLLDNDPNNTLFDFKLDWIDDSTGQGIINNYGGLFIPSEKKILVREPSITHTPIILIHEIFHALKLIHRTGGNQNIMGDDFLTTNYKLSTEQLSIMNGHEAIFTIDQTIIPTTPCILITNQI